MFNINTQCFREAAVHFDKYGRYADGTHNSYEYHEYWNEEMLRCLNGYQVGDMWITGYHYWYLNYWPIWLTRANEERAYGEVTKIKRRSGTRDFDFAEFWDVDYEFFLQIDLAVKNGQHFVWLKPRGVGASYKGSAMAGRNYHCIPGSKNYMLAHSNEFLAGDGLFTKWLEGRMFHNRPHPEVLRPDVYHTAFAKASDFKKDTNDMHYIASIDIGGGIEGGFKSQIMGLPLRDDLQKARGKRGMLVLLEEMGAFPKVEQVFNIIRSSVEQDDVVYGLILGFGTGGTNASVFGDMEKMFYNPEAYNLRCFDNIWDEGMQGTKCAYFTPSYRSIGYIDSNGNSLEREAKAYQDQQRKLATQSSDANAIIQVKAEKPYSPQEAILRTSYSVLPSNEAREWHHRVLSMKYHTMGIPGEVTNNGNGIEFVPNFNLHPVDKFPHDIKSDLTGCVVQYYAPLKIDGKVPENLYFISHDPYAHDQSTDSESLGATYVYMQPTNLPNAGLGDRIVATYFGRPKTTDDYNKILFDLALYYNAKIAFENDRGDVIGYAKRFKKLDWLAEEFELAFDADIPKSKVKRNFGMHIGSGKENLRLHKGNKYLADWLITPRGMGADGIPVLQLHTFNCLSTLKEIELYRSDSGNFDRIAALRILAYYRKEIVYKELNPIVNSSSSSNFFNRKHFQTNIPGRKAA